MKATHKNLLAWQKAMSLVMAVYRETSAFPSHEMFGLTSQIRRAAVSVPSNIAEGAGRNSPKELIQFLGIASGSLAELDTQLNIASGLGYLDEKSVLQEEVNRVGQLLTALRRSIRTGPRR